MCLFDLVVRGVFSKIVTTFSSRSFPFCWYNFCDFSRLPLVLLLDGGRLLLPLQLPPPLLQQLVLLIPQYHLQLQVPQLSDSSRISICRRLWTWFHSKMWKLINRSKPAVLTGMLGIAPHFLLLIVQRRKRKFVSSNYLTSFSKPVFCILLSRTTWHDIRNKNGRQDTFIEANLLLRQRKNDKPRKGEIGTQRRDLAI